MPDRHIDNFRAAKLANFMQFRNVDPMILGVSLYNIFRACLPCLFFLPG